MKNSIIKFIVLLIAITYLNQYGTAQSIYNIDPARTVRVDYNCYKSKFSGYSKYRLEGNILSRESSGFKFYNPDLNDTLSIPEHCIKRIQIQIGTRNLSSECAVVGGAIGFIIGFLSYTPPEYLPYYDFTPLYVILGSAIIGGGIGAFIGSTILVKRWKTVKSESIKLTVSTTSIISNPGVSLKLNF